MVTCKISLWTILSLVLFSDVESNNALHFKEKHMNKLSDPPKLYHGFNPLKTSPEYTRAGVYGKCVL